MRFSDDFLRRVREMASIADYAGRRLTWDRRKSQPAKGEYWACCPFHNEKSPSFHVLDGKGVYHCFGCQESGSVIDLAMRLDGLSFPEAVERLADFAGLALPQSRDGDGESDARLKRLFVVLDAATKIFQANLQGPAGANARAYLAQRGLEPAIITEFGLGFALDGWSSLLEALQAKGFSWNEIEGAGLAKQNEGRRPIDVFRNRVIFPIADGRGRVIAFGGRALDPEQPAKYLNSPETALFHKGSTLYRLAEAKRRLAKGEGPGLVAAEGYVDVIALARAGCAAVAPLGTALTEAQLQLMWRAAPAPILCFDGDGAGQRAGARAMDLALPHLGPNRTLRIAFLPAGQDPDDVFRKQGAGALRALIDQALPISAALFAREQAAQPLDTPEARAGLRARLREASARIQDGETRRQYELDFQKRSDEALGQGQASRPPFSVKKKFERGQRRFEPEIRARPETKASSAAPRSGPNTIEFLLKQAIAYPTLLHLGQERLAALSIEDAALNEIRHALLDLASTEQAVDLAALSNHVSRIGHHSAALRLAAWASPTTGKPSLDHRLEGEWLALLDEALSDKEINAEFRSFDAEQQDDNWKLAQATRLATERAANAERVIASRRDPKP
jgi:DNA primase